MLVSEEIDDTTTNCDGCNNSENEKICSIDEDLFQNRHMEEGIEDNDPCHTEAIIINDANIKHDNTIMFESSKTTVDEVVQMIHSYCVRFNSSDEARFALFNMASIWAGPKFSNFMNSKYVISKRLDPPEELFQYIFYCSKCNCLLDKFYRKDLLTTTYRHCEKCQETYKMSTNSSNCFVSTDVKYQVQVLLQNSNVRKLLFQNIKDIENRLKNKNLNNIVDIHDGELYRRLYNNKRKKTVLLTFNFNLDGAFISKSSKSSMWPIQLIINELPLKIRFSNILLAGMWITNSEPSSQFMNLYINVFINQIRDLMTNGIIIDMENGQKCNFILQPLCSSVDSVARPIIQNRFQFNGYFGCSWCYQYGEYFNGAMRYPFMDDDPPLRDHDSYIKNIKYVEEIGRPFKGVKGFAEITQLENFDCVWGFPFDYMHGMLLGVANTLWTKFWTNNRKEEYNLSKSDIRNIEKRLLSIKLPSEIHRSPRSFNSGKWKASEWRSWILYLSIPCLLGIMKTKYLSSFALLVRCTHKLLSESITIEDLRQL
ncbi:uncharacterized protein LOC112466937 [Temnothorax curvispinosus]|uniref:Uncharacterized protein LOC112466937 n=1 Tax=Temnothorax curvispinosus TaxID=300111 RepID=A0A6J1R8S3_9HYME|nr:uncharacterized protein LOC112466937 [Temnothorax curvispinosus]